jgi:hypothetical protein
MIDHEIQWTSPSPLWLEAIAFDGLIAQRQMRSPAILRFAADSFMEDFLKIVETDPDKLRSLVAIKETWRGPAEKPEAEALLEPSAPESSFARRLNRVRLVAERAKNGGSLVAALRNGDARRTAPLKLYQPAHQRYYLVSACLVCGIAGLPDRALDTAKQEKVSFVIRRLLPHVTPPLGQDLPDVDLATWDEYAMVSSPAGAGWQKIEKTSGVAPAVVLPGEERLPLFPSSFAEDDGRKRRLFAGLIPVGKREAYMGASVREPNAPSSQNGSVKPPANSDPRMLLLWTQVTEPWKRLIELAAGARPRIYGAISPPFDDKKPTPAQQEAAVKASREQIQIGSWYILLDFAKLLKEQLPNVIRKIAGESVSLSSAETAVVSALNAAALTDLLRTDLKDKTSYTLSAIPSKLADALVKILGGAPLNQQAADALETKLENVSAAYNRSAGDAKTVWAPFIFPLADVGLKPQPGPMEGPFPPPAVGLAFQPGPFQGPFPPAGPEPQPLDAVEKVLARIKHLSDLIYAALPPLPPGPLPALPIGAEAPLDPREGWFAIRCAFERPNCGPLEPPVVSETTRPFQMASFFDPDAPARPIRIALPIDTSPAGLRKFDKKAAFMISDMLCGQIDRVKGLSLGDLVLSVLPWPFHKDLSVPEKGPCKQSNGLEIGMICSLSIPIITICALLLLMIIVSLLDIIFRWIPFFLICFPLPGIKAKKA